MKTIYNFIMFTLSLIFTILSVIKLVLTAPFNPSIIQTSINLIWIIIGSAGCFLHCGRE